MQIPFFYRQQPAEPGERISLDEDSSRHIASVLRMKAGEPVHLTDGRGRLLTAQIAEEHKKHCIVEITGGSFEPQHSRRVSIAISLLKNTGRFEWFLEKITEIGVNAIIPLLCERTERRHFHYERMRSILVSAMLQSRQCWLPELHEPIAFGELLRESRQEQRFIAHCLEDARTPLDGLADSSLSSQLVAIGPEGDFTPGEIKLALQQGFVPVMLGETRLRTETAGIVAATLLRIKS
jgi:16S rRNA (uracil1498-N3)-methyltransferase